jgi:hypothetical protein
MVDGLHIFIGNRANKPLAIALSGAEKRLRELRGRNSRGDLINV